MAFRLCSWNIHLGLALPRILRSIQAGPEFEDLDVLLLQEASMRDRQDDADSMAQVLGPAYRARQHNVDQFHGHTRGLAVVWNSASFALTGVEMLPLPHLHASQLARRQRTWLHPLRLRPRSAMVIDGLLRGRPLRLYNIHLSPVGFAFQTAQMAAVMRHLAHHDGPELVVLAGDFNSLRTDRRKWAGWFAARTAEGFHNASAQVEWTFRSPALPLRQKLDNALVRGGATRCSCSCPPYPGSDHRPLFLDIASPQD